MVGNFDHARRRYVCIHANKAWIAIAARSNCFCDQYTRVNVHFMLTKGTGAATTGPTMSTVFFFLLNYPETLQHATTEVRGAFSTEDEICLGPKLNSCKYLNACIDETLRMVPVLANALPREVQAGGMVVEGSFFPEGTVLGSSIYALHRNEKYFPEADTFRPERWLEDDHERVRLARKAFNPFSTGPRFCVGWRLAVAELSLTLAKTIFTYDMRLAPNASCCSGQPDGRRCTDRKFGSYVGVAFDGPVAQFKARVV